MIKKSEREFTEYQKIEQRIDQATDRGSIIDTMRGLVDMMELLTNTLKLALCPECKVQVHQCQCGWFDRACGADDVGLGDE